MTLAPGVRLGSYEILSAIGAGGMGEVYRARDTKLGRDVAVKILPSSFAADPERVARFQREAQVLAALNHPHIAAIYGLEEHAGSQFLVLELVEGETLAHKLGQVGRERQERRVGQVGPYVVSGFSRTVAGLPIDEGLAIARQVADALQAAHDKGIIHRDLKPANIALTDTGQVKVLDFGLAKYEAGGAGRAGGGDGVDGFDVTNSPTLTFAATQAGVILGTAAYMSPEQAKGRVADKRSDIWGFGCVLFEMLTGRRAFEGADASDTLAAVLRAEPDWTALPDNTPSQIRRVLRRCLQKDRDRRLRDVGDVSLDIDEALAAPDTPAPSVSQGSLTSRLGARERLAWMLLSAVLAIIVVGVAATAYLRTPALDDRRVEFEIAPSERTSFAGSGALASVPSPALSADGRRLAFVAVGSNGSPSLWVRAFDSASATVLPGTDGAALPFWSPDGRSIGFFAQGKLKKIDLSGGTPQTLCDASGFAGGATWSSAGTILFAPTWTSPLYRVPATGGLPTAVTTLDASQQESGHLWPSFLPDGRHFLYLVRSAKPGRAGIFVASLDAGEPKRLLSADSPAAFGAGRYLLFLAGTDLMAQPFHAGRLELTGAPIRVAERVQYLRAIGSYGAFSVSTTDALVFRAGMAGAESDLVWFDRTGTQLGQVPVRANYTVPSLSADDRKIAVNILGESGNDVWVLDAVRNTRQRLTFDRTAVIPVWSPDGSHVLYPSEQAGPGDLYQKSTSTGTEDTLLKSNAMKNPTDWSADGHFILYETQDPKTNTDIWALPTTGDRKPFPVLNSEFNEYQGRTSPDGRWIAYVSDESGSLEVYVQSFPKPSGKWQISTAGGGDPRWRRDGKELYFISSDRKLMAVDIKADATFQSGLAQALFDVRVSGLVDVRGHYAVSADGRRFLVNWLGEGGGSSPMTVVLNWTSALRK